MNCFCPTSSGRALERIWISQSCKAVPPLSFTWLIASRVQLTSLVCAPSAPFHPACAPRVSILSSLQTPGLPVRGGARQICDNVDAGGAWVSAELGDWVMGWRALATEVPRAGGGGGVSELRVGTAVTAGLARDRQRCPRDSVPGAKGSGRTFTCAFWGSGHQVSDFPLRGPSWPPGRILSLLRAQVSGGWFQKGGSRSIASGSEIQLAKLCWTRRRKAEALQVSDTE